VVLLPYLLGSLFRCEPANAEHLSDMAKEVVMTGVCSEILVTIEGLLIPARSDDVDIDSSRWLKVWF